MRSEPREQQGACVVERPLRDDKPRRLEVCLPTACETEHVDHGLPVHGDEPMGTNRVGEEHLQYDAGHLVARGAVELEDGARVIVDIVEKVTLVSEDECRCIRKKEETY